MFFKKKSDLYPVKNLYVGILGYVTKNKHSLLIEREDNVIIYKREKIDSYDICAKEILTNQTYYFFQGNFCDEDTIYKAINSLAIHSFLPLSQIVKDEYITKDELIELYDKLNKLIREKEHPNQEPSYPVTDSILQMILETNKKVKESSIEENLKKDIIKQLEILGEYYVNEVINRLDGNNALTTENEYTIKMNTMKKLVEIETFFGNPIHEKKYSLKKQLNQFKKDLR